MKFLTLLCVLLVYVPTQAHNRVPLKVAVVDSGYTPEEAPLCPSSRDFMSTGDLQDRLSNFHGTNVVGLIAKHAGPGPWCAEVLKVYNQSPTLRMSDYYSALRWIIFTRPALANFSLSGTSFIYSEFLLIEKILAQGTTIIAAVGNDDKELEPVCGPTCAVYPACLDPRIVKVANSTGARVTGYGILQVDGSRQTGAGITLSGSSQSTAIVTGDIVHEILKGSK